MQRRRLFFAGVAMAFGVCVALASGEIALRVMQRPAPADIGWTGGKPAQSNQFNFRGNQFDAAAAIRLLLVGDSQVEANSVPVSGMPEVQLRDALSHALGTSISVASIGSAGWGQDQELLAVERHIDAIRPAAVVLWFTEGNDLWNNTFPTHMPTDGQPKPTFWLVGAQLQGPNLPFLQPYRPSGLYLGQAIRRARGMPVYPTDAEWERRLPPAYQAQPLPAGTRALTSVLADKRGISPDEVPYFSDENFDNEKTHYSIYLTPPSPRLEYSAALTRALLQRIQAACEAHGSRFFILTTERWDLFNIPDAPTLFGVRGKGYMFSTATARHIIAGVLEGLPVIAVTDVPPEAVVSKTDSHWNADGNRVAMEAVARRLVGELRAKD